MFEPKLGGVHFGEVGGVDFPLICDFFFVFFEVAFELNPFR